MQVTRSRHGWGRLKRPPLAAVLMLALAGVGGIANAVEFDETIKAPMMKNATETRAQAKSFAVKYRETRAATPALLITNASLARQQFDLKWQIQRAIDEGKPLDEFAELGLVSQGDGTFGIDMREHPQWETFPETIVGLLAGSNTAFSAPHSSSAGFVLRTSTISRTTSRHTIPSSHRRLRHCPSRWVFPELSVNTTGSSDQFQTLW